MAGARHQHEVTSGWFAARQFITSFLSLAGQVRPLDPSIFNRSYSLGDSCYSWAREVEKELRNDVIRHRLDKG
jgi:hypothetical protein